MNWDAVVTLALAHPGVGAGVYWNDPAVKAANGRPILTPGREEGSFCLHLDLDTIEMLKETEPETYWQTPHYQGWPAVLVRYDTANPERVAEMIARSHGWASSRKPVKARKK